MATIRDIPAQLTAPNVLDRVPVADMSVSSGDKDKYIELGQMGILALAQTFSALQTFAAGIKLSLSTLIGDTVDGVNIQSGGISHSVHTSDHRWRSWATNGYYISTTRVNAIAFDVSLNSAVTVRISYNQFNTGTGSDEPYMGLGVATITRANPSFVVNSAAYLGNNHCTIGFEISGARILVYLIQAGGTSFRSTDSIRNVMVEVMGGISNIEVAPDTI